MMYNYIKLADDTQIAHSNILEDQTVQVSIERPVDGGFCSATFFLPQCRWQSVEGFNASELEYFTEIVRNNAPPSSTVLPERRESNMPRVLVFGAYIIFFWVGENGEPVHVHVAPNALMAASTTIRPRPSTTPTPRGSWSSGRAN